MTIQQIRNLCSGLAIAVIFVQFFIREQWPTFTNNMIFNNGPNAVAGFITPFYACFALNITNFEHTWIGRKRLIGTAQRPASTAAFVFWTIASFVIWTVYEFRQISVPDRRTFDAGDIWATAVGCVAAFVMYFGFLKRPD